MESRNSKRSKPLIYKKTQLLIRRNDSLSTFEDYLSNPRFLNFEILMPSDLSHGGSIGRSLSLSQLFLTWARRGDNPTIQTYLEHNNNEKYESFTSRCHGLSAVYFAKQVRPRNSLQNIRTQLLLAAAQRITAMHNSDLPKTSFGRGVEYIFVQDARQQFHREFYLQPPKYPSDLLQREIHGRLVNTVQHFNDFFIRCIKTLNVYPDSRQITQMPSIVKWCSAPDYAIGTMIYEAFRNTAEHACLRPDGTRYRENLRCVKITVSTMKKHEFRSSVVSAVRSSKTASAYFGSIGNLHGRFQRGTIDFLEVSIFDSGPGFRGTIDRAFDTSLSDSQTVARCFEKHRSAKLSASSGLGLNRILELVYHLNGFLRIRTSTVEVFFATSRDLTPTSSPLDFIHGELPSVEGTVLTIGIPIAY